MKALIEIRDLEGGDDAKLLVQDMKSIYLKTIRVNGFKTISVKDKVGQVTIEVQGYNVKEFFLKEVGGHRFQRVPPTESKGRVHTSIVSVSVMDNKKEINNDIDMNDIGVMYTKGTGPGGQHKNKTQSCVVLTHKPSGIKVRIDGRNQHKNKKDALKELQRRLDEKYKKETQNDTWNNIKEQVGSGMRGDKRRTYRIRDNRVHDHITGKKSQWKKIQKGEIDLLH